MRIKTYRPKVKTGRRKPRISVALRGKKRYGVKRTKKARYR